MTTLDPRALEALKNNQRQLDMDGCEVGVSRQALDELLADYAALSQPQAGEPVAWRHRYNGRWYVCDSEEFARKGLDVHPLYASPPPSGAVVSVDAVAKMIAAWQQECAAFPDLYNQGHVLADRLAALASPQPALAVKGLEWPEPKVTNPDIGKSTGVPYLDCLIDRLLDAQQDINLAANESMDQSLCDASALLDEIETCLRRVVSPPPSGAVEALRVTDAMVEAAAKTLWPSSSTTWEEAYNSPPSSYNGYQVVYWLRKAKIALDAALSTAPATADGWRTMEDAPKDGTSILAAHHQAAIVVQWYEDRSVDGAPGWGDGETDLDGYFYTYPVTHWRPLPPLPAAPTATGGR